MQIVIDIPEDVKAVIDRKGTNEIVAETLWQAVKNGKSLPKGHGRLIDADDIKSYFSDREGGDFTAFHFYDAVEDVSTIIEADKAESEEE